MATKQEMLAEEPAKKTKKERNLYRAIELIPESGKYSSKLKYEVLTTYIREGMSVSATVEKTGVPRETIRNWLKAKWWDEVQDLIMEVNQRKVAARLHNVIDRTISNIETQMDQGEEVLIKGYDGVQKYRQEIKAGDNIKLLGMALDKQYKLRALEREERMAEEAAQGSSTDNKLVDLAQACIDIARKAQGKDTPKTVEGEIIDGEIEDGND